LRPISYWCSDSKQGSYSYFFFDGRDSQNGLQRHEHLIHSLLWQFCEQLDTLPEELDNLYCQCGFGLRQPSSEHLQSALLRILQLFQDAYIIIDALDECSERGKLLEWIDDVSRAKVRQVHLLATSRHEQVIETRLRPLSLSFLCLEGDFIDGDIATYLDFVLRDNQDLKAWNRDADICQKVKTSLLQGAQGMYGGSIEITSFAFDISALQVPMGSPPTRGAAGLPESAPG
jgi:hypothetical protein